MNEKNMLEVEKLKKSYGRETVLRDLSFSVREGDILSILGRSGSGKTTLLKILAGLKEPDDGEVLLRGRPVLHLPPQKRGMVYLYQETLLFPHLNVFENMAFGLRVRKLPEKEIRQRTEQLLDELGMAGHTGKMPEQLSGGQQQRVAFGRALIINPTLLLLDEPFGKLDSRTREEMQELFLRICREYRISVLFVTHDLKEALCMGDRIARMEQGQLKIYAQRSDFIRDAASGAKKEMDFWTGIREESKKKNKDQ